MTSVDVASESGVSQATVARVFSSPHLVSDDTRSRVEEVAARLGYVPNAIARSLKSERTNIIGAVVPAFGEYWQNVLTEFSRQLARADRQLLLFSFADPEDVDVALAAVAQYRLDGLLLASATIGTEQLSRTGNQDIPVVAFNQPAAVGLVPSVSVDNEAGMSELARHLIAVGITEAVYVGGIAGASTDQLRYRGAVSTLAEAGVALPYIEAGAYTYEAGYKTAAHIVERDSVPHAVMVGSDEVAFGLSDGLQAAGLRVPDDILLTGFDGLPEASWASYDLTTLVQNTSVLVSHAVKLLMADVTPQGESPANVVVPGTLRPGRTTRRSDG